MSITTMINIKVTFIVILLCYLGNACHPGRPTGYGAELFVSTEKDTDSIKSAEPQGSTGDHRGDFDGNLFLITNQEYSYANLALTKDGQVTTYEPKIDNNQFWRFEEDMNHKGYFRIWNFHQDNLRLAQTPCYHIGTIHCNNEMVIATEGGFSNYQLWKFVDQGNGYYSIYNFYWGHKLRKYGKANGDVSSSPEDRGSLWKLTPRFRVSVTREVLWHIDNRQGETEVCKEVRKIVGLKTSESKEEITKRGMKTSMSLGIAKLGLSVSGELMQELSTAISTYKEKSEHDEAVIKLTALAGKDYRVTRLKTTFHDKNPNGGDIVFFGKQHVESEDHKLPENLPPVV